MPSEKTLSEQLASDLFKLVGISDPKSVLDNMLSICCQLMKAESATFVLWESAMGVFYSNFQFPQEIPLMGQILTPDNGGLDGKLFQEKKVEYLSNYSKNMYVFPPFKSANYQFALGIPLIFEGNVQATVSFYFKNRTEKLTTNELENLNLVHDYLNTILKFVQNYQKCEAQKLELQQTRNFLDVLISSTPDLIINTDVTGKVKFWNHTAENITGYDASEMINIKMPIANLQAEEEFILCITEARKGSKIFNRSFPILTKKESTIPCILSLSFIPVQNSQGEIDSILITGMDISESNKLKQKVAEIDFALLQTTVELKNVQTQYSELKEEMQIAERLATIGQLTDSLSHNINNPLMTIINDAQFIAEDTIVPFTDPASEIGTITGMNTLANEIIHEAARITQVVKGLKEYSEFAKETHYRPTPILEVLNQAIQGIKADFTSQKIKLIKNIDQDMQGSYLIIGNFQQLKRVFVNLLQNALIAVSVNSLKNTEKTIRIQLERNSSVNPVLIQITISDTGIGIKKEQLNSMFNPFYSDWGDTIESKKDHIGLGLAIAKTIIQNHNGTIEIKSKEEQGTFIIVTLPEISADK
jgi:two-component system, sporulation sensor kinase E